MQPAPSLKRPKLRMLNAIRWPLPISPSRRSFGILRVLQQQRRRRRPALTHLVLFGAVAHAGIVALDDEAGELLAVDFGEDDVDVGERAVGDPHLLAVQNPVRPFGIESRGGLGRERVGARARIRSGNRPKPIRPSRSSAGISSSAPRCRNKRSAAARCWSSRRRSWRTNPGRTCVPRSASTICDRAPARRTASGMLAASSPSSPAFCSRLALQFVILLFDLARCCGTTSFSMYSAVVCAIIRCSSVKSSGEKTSSGVVSEIRKLPPLKIFFVCQP